MLRQKQGRNPDATSTLRENESYEFGDLMCLVKLNVRTLIMKRKHLNAAMICESAYTISKIEICL